MIMGIGTEAGIFLYDVITGITVLAFYRAVREFRGLVRHSTLAVGLEDLAFWTGASIYLFWRMYEVTYGSVRWYFLLGTAAGAGAGTLVFRLPGIFYAKGKKMLEKYRKSR